jgi:hypothetical protein
LIWVEEIWWVLQNGIPRHSLGFASSMTYETQIMMMWESGLSSM